jgi:hypothetical protein
MHLAVSILIAAALASPAPKDGDKLACNISLPFINWQKPGPVLVSVELKNVTKDGIDTQVVPVFELLPLPADTSFNKPGQAIDAEWNWTIGGPLAAGSRVRLQLQSGASKTFTVDVSELLWVRLISAVIPYFAEESIPRKRRLPDSTFREWKLYNGVDPGRYAFHFEVSGAGANLCSSDPVEVRIDK